MGALQPIITTFLALWKCLGITLGSYSVCTQTEPISSGLDRINYSVVSIFNTSSVCIVSSRLFWGWRWDRGRVWQVKNQPSVAKKGPPLGSFWQGDPTCPPSIHSTLATRKDMSLARSNSSQKCGGSRKVGEKWSSAGKGRSAVSCVVWHIPPSPYKPKEQVVHDRWPWIWAGTFGGSFKGKKKGDFTRIHTIWLIDRSTFFHLSSSQPVDVDPAFSWNQGNQSQRALNSNHEKATKLSNLQ